MPAISWLLLLISLTFLLNPALSATIIITPNDSSPKENTTKTNPNSQNLDSTYLVQLIKNYFGCAQFNNGQCIRCETTYFLGTDGKCSRVSDDCRTFNVQQGLCTLCLNGSVLVDGACYPVNSTANTLKNHCVVWSYQQCLKCQKGYFLSSGNCRPVDINFQCRLWSEDGTCLACNNGFSLTVGMCIQSPKFLNCPSNQYFSQNGKCELSPANCQTWDPYNGRCVKCFSQFDLVDWKCVCSANGYCLNQFCQRYNLDDRKSCDTCVSTFVLEKGKCNDKLLPQNCVKWNENRTICAACKENYFLSALTKQCVPVLLNCQAYSPTGNCISCKQKYDLINQKCEEAIVIQNCDKYDPLNRKLCSVCKLGYVLQKNICNPKLLPLNCKKWNQNFMQCSECQQKWTINPVNRQCVEFVQNCLTYGLNNQCQACAQQYDLINKKCELIIMIPNCQQYALNNRKQCIQCQQGYDLSSNQCKERKLPANCLAWNSDKSLCGSCKDTYVLIRGFCYSKIDNCQTYSVNGQCINCVEKYEIVNKKCEQTVVISNCVKYSPSNRFSCIQCGLGFEIFNAKCREKPLPKNCQKWDDKKISCGKCKTKYVLNLTNGECSEEVVNCTKYTVSGQCIACINNYEPSQGICRLKADSMTSSQFYGCDTWNFTSNKCNNCFDSFDLNKQGYCFYNEDHCLERNEKSFCTKCKDGYVVITGNCQVKSDLVIENKVGCKVYDWVNNNCLACEDEFVRKSTGQCQKPLQNCLQMGTNGCTKCSPNYDLKNGKCESFATSKCIEVNGTSSCKKCENSFALIGGECRTFKQLGTILLDYNQFSPDKLKEKIVIFTDKPKV